MKTCSPKYDGFVRINPGLRNIDRWIIRVSILRSIRAAYPLFRGALLDLGCGRMPYRTEIKEKTKVSRYVGVDLETARCYDREVAPDVRWDGQILPFGEGEFDCVIATEVFEHVFDIDSLLVEIRRVMKRDGVLFFTTPFLWPYHEMPYDSQRWTAAGLVAKLRKAGFSSIAVESIGNWHSALAQFLGLWAARSPMPRSVRWFVRAGVLILQRLLMLVDSNSKVIDDSMPRLITGVCRA